MTETQEFRERRRRTRRRGMGRLVPRRWRRRDGEASPRRRALILVALVIVVGVAGWTAWTVRGVYTDLTRAKDHALILRAALARGDAPGAGSALSDFREASDSAAEGTQGAVWRAFERLPLLGDDVEVLTQVSSALAELGRTALPPLVDAAGDLSAGTYAPDDARFPLDDIAGLTEPAAQSSAAFDSAAEELSAIDSDGFVAPLRREYDDLVAEVVSAASTLRTAERAARLMPSLLGGDGPRNYLLVFQNNAELRATGGLPGVLSLVRADRGAVEITDQTVGGAFQTDEPVLPLSVDEQRLYGDAMGTFFVNANFTPDLPRAAELWRAHLERRADVALDGILVVDPVAVSYLLAAAGPIQVNGVTLTGDNVVQAVENGTYLQLPLQEDQDAFFKGVAEAAFDVFADGAGDPVALIEGLARGVAEGRVGIHSFDDVDQRLVAGTRIAGELPVVATPRPQVGVYLNDGTGAKMSYYLDYDVVVTSASCLNGVQSLVGRLRATSDTPQGVGSLPESVTGPPSLRGEIAPGSQVAIAQLVAPVGGRITGVALDGRRLPDPVAGRLGGREVTSVGLRFDPQESHEVSFTMTSGPGQDEPVDVSVTPGARPENESGSAPSAC